MPIFMSWQVDLVQEAGGDVEGGIVSGGTTLTAIWPSDVAGLQTILLLRKLGCCGAAMPRESPFPPKDGRWDKWPLVPRDLRCFSSPLGCVVLWLERDDVAQTFQALDRIAPKLLGLELVKVVRAQVDVLDLLFQ